MKTFKEYVLSRKITDTPTGGFVQDVRIDRDFPESFADAEELARHIRQRGGCREDVRAATGLYRRWVRAVA